MSFRILAGIAVALALGPCALAYPQFVAQVDGAPASYGAFKSVISADGRFVGFHSNDPLDPDDTDWANDAYVLDRVTGVYHNLSEHPTTGALTPGLSYAPVLSADGRVAAFRSTQEYADHLYGSALPNPGGGFVVMVTDRDTDADGVFDELDGRSTWALPNSGLAYGDQEPCLSVSGDGRRIAYLARQTDLSGLALYLHDRDTDTDGVFDEPGASSTTLIMSYEENDRYGCPMLSLDGSVLAISWRRASDLKVVINRYAVATAQWSELPYAGQYGRAVRGISGDGDRMVFDENGGAYLQTMSGGTVQRLDVLDDGSNPPADAQGSAQAISADGRFVLLRAEAYDTDDAGFEVGIADAGYLYLLDTTLGTRRALHAYHADAKIGYVSGTVRTQALSADGTAVTLEAGHLQLPRYQGDESQVYLFDLTPADLRVTVGDAGDQYVMGILSYPITLRNHGTGIARGAYLRAYGPLGGRVSTATLGGQPCSLPFLPGGEGQIAVIECAAGDLAPGAELSGLVRVTMETLSGDADLIAFADSEQLGAPANLARDTGQGTNAEDFRVTLSLPSTRKHKGDPFKLKYTIASLTPGPTFFSGDVQVRIRITGAVRRSAAQIAATPNCLATGANEWSCSSTRPRPGNPNTREFGFIPTSTGTISVSVTLQPSVAVPDRNSANDAAVGSKRIYK